MIHVSKQEFINWIFKQPNYKKIDYDHIINDHNSGCPMVQYGQSKNWEFTHVSAFGWSSRESVMDKDVMARFADDNFRFTSFYFKEINTFGQLKLNLQMKFNEKEIN